MDGTTAEFHGSKTSFVILSAVLGNSQASCLSYGPVFACSSHLFE